MGDAKSQVEVSLATARFVGSDAGVTSEQIGFYLAHVAFEMSLARIASAAGVSRDVVAKACHVVEDRRDHIEFDAIMDACVQSLQQLPAHNALFQKAVANGDTNEEPRPHSHA